MYYKAIPLKDKKPNLGILRKKVVLINSETGDITSFILGVAVEWPYYEARFTHWLKEVSLQSILDKGWTLVENGLPDIGEEYNVIYDLKDGEEPVTTTMDYDAREKKWYDTRGAGVECKTVIAWREIPGVPKRILKNWKESR